MHAPSAAIRGNLDCSAAYYGRALMHVRRRQYAEARADLHDRVQHGGEVDIRAIGLPDP